MKIVLLAQGCFVKITASLLNHSFRYDLAFKRVYQINFDF